MLGFIPKYSLKNFFVKKLNELYSETAICESCRGCIYRQSIARFVFVFTMEQSMNVMSSIEHSEKRGDEPLHFFTQLMDGKLSQNQDIYVNFIKILLYNTAFNLSIHGCYGFFVLFFD